MTAARAARVELDTVPTSVSWTLARIADETTECAVLPVVLEKHPADRFGFLDSGTSYRLPDAKFLERNPGLYLRFADLADEADAYLEFAKHYGYLGLWSELDSAGGDPLARYGEPLDAWQDAHRLIATAATLWEATRAADTEALERLIATSKRTVHVDDGGEAPCFFLGLRVPLHRLTGERGRPYVSISQRYSEQPGPHAYTDFGWYALARLVDSNLRSHTSVRLRPARRGSRPSVSVEPDNLFGALWLSLARAIENDATITTCTRCHELFVEKARSDKAFCDACRKDVSAKRRALAGDLARSTDLTPEQILERVLVDYPVHKSYLTRTTEAVLKRIQIARSK